MAGKCGYCDSKLDPERDDAESEFCDEVCSNQQELTEEGWEEGMTPEEVQAEYARRRAEAKSGPIFEVCGECQGHGRHVTESLREASNDFWAEDHESFEYMLAGGYDVTCTVCKGEKVVDVSPRGRLTRRMKAPWWKYDPISIQERRMGA